MREPAKVEVDGVNYLINLMSPLQANRIVIQLTKSLGKPVANFLMQAVKGDTEKNKLLLDTDIKKLGLNNIDAMAKGLMELTSSLDADEVEDLITTLLNKDYVIPDGKKYANVNLHFGNYGLLHMYKVCYQVLVANFRDFLDELAGSGV